MLGWTERALIAHHVAKGLVYMHSLDPPVIHRDIKGGNVLLKTTERGLVAKISDFGIVRVNTEQQEGVLRTSERTHGTTLRICGTGTL